MVCGMRRRPFTHVVGCSTGLRAAHKPCSSKMTPKGALCGDLAYLKKHPSRHYDQTSQKIGCITFPQLTAWWLH